MELFQNPLVCFFDSGIGGLNLLYESVKRLPHVDFMYFSDTARMPYGNLSHEELLTYTDEIFEKISEKNPCAAVTACNTVTAECVEFLRKRYSFPIVGVQPAVKPASKIGGQILVLLTSATANSESFKRLIKPYEERINVYPCKDLANYVEKNIFNISREEVIRLLPPAQPKSVVLGCTHYSFLKDIISNYYNCPVFDGLDGAAERLKSVLNMSCEGERNQRIIFTGGAEEKNRLVFDSLLLKNGFDTKNAKKT